MNSFLTGVGRILGMFRESEIRIARIETARIEALAEERF
jgi:hypothetical protein